VKSFINCSFSKGTGTWRQFNLINGNLITVMYWDKSIQRCARRQLRDGANRKPSADPSSVGKSFWFEFILARVKVHFIYVPTWNLTSFEFLPTLIKFVRHFVEWLYSPCGPSPLFQFPDLFTIGRTPWTSDQPITVPLPKHRTAQTQNKHIYTRNIHDLSGIRTHDHSVRASEHSSCLRPLGYRDRQTW
jgi:hypothetical protein